jgi:integrase/recombinase XerD
MSDAFHGRGRSPERACRKLEDWPETDRRLWLAALEPGDLLDAGGSRSRYRATSNRKTERGYGRWLTFLNRRAALAGAPADRITPATVAQYVAELQVLGNGSYTILSRLQELYDTATVMEPKRDWSFIRRFASRVRTRQAPVRDKNRKLVGTDDLLDLGRRLMERANALPTDRRRTIMFRDGLILTFLALRPLRLRNLAGLTLDRHLQLVGDTWVVIIPAEETKTGTPLEFPWPEQLVPALQAWLDRWRPILCLRKGRWSRPAETDLWISSDGSPMTPRAIYDRVVERTRTAFGVGINPHFFRDIAATTLAYADPARVRISAQLLGHQSFATTEQYYVRANMVAANRRRQESLLRLRHSSPNLVE